MKRTKCYHQIIIIIVVVQQQNQKQTKKKDFLIIKFYYLIFLGPLKFWLGILFFLCQQVTIN